MISTQKLIFQKDAQEDVNEIAHYIAEDNPTAASAFFDALDKCCELLLVLPEMGSIPDDLSHYSTLKGVRVLPLQRFEKYLMFYRPVMDGKIEIVRVVHGARDLPALFGDTKRTKEVEEV